MSKTKYEVHVTAECTAVFYVTANSPEEAVEEARKRVAPNTLDDPYHMDWQGAEAFREEGA